MTTTQTQNERIKKIVYIPNTKEKEEAQRLVDEIIDKFKNRPIEFTAFTLRILIAGFEDIIGRDLFWERKQKIEAEKDRQFLEILDKGCGEEFETLYNYGKMVRVNCPYVEIGFKPLLCPHCRKLKQKLRGEK